MLWLWIALGVVAILLVVVVLGYNRLVRLRNEVDTGWANIDVQLQRRGDLIPNLVETVKGYAAHERGVFEEVTRRAPRCSRPEGPPRPARRTTSSAPRWAGSSPSPRRTPSSARPRTSSACRTS